MNTLTYNAAPASRHVVKPLPFSASSASTLYDPPITEFSVVTTALSPGQTERHRVIDGPSIMIVVGGTGKIQWDKGSVDVVRGEVVFIGADLVIGLVAAGEEKFEIYRAFVEA